MRRFPLFIRLLAAWLIVAVGSGEAAPTVLTYDPSGNTLAQRPAATGNAPVIATQPLNRTGEAGGGIGFSVNVTSDTPVAYQWKFNGAPIAGATNDSLFIPAVTAATEGRYYVVITNAAGSSTSNIALLASAASAPAITTHPTDQSIAASGVAVFTAGARGAPAPTFQWQRQLVGTTTWINVADGNLFAGAKTSALTVSGSGAADGDRFRCVASTGVGLDATSDFATLRITPVAASAVAWDDAYAPSLGTLPDAQGWTPGDGAPSLSEPPAVANGVLHQGPTSFGNYQYWQRQSAPSDFASYAGRIFEIDLKVIASTYGDGGFTNTWRSGYYINFNDEGRRPINLGIADTGVRISNDDILHTSASSAFVPFDTTSDFNTYQLAVNGAGLVLRINGTIMATLPLGNGPTSNPPNSIYFGDGTSGGSSETLLRSFRWGRYAAAPVIATPPASQTTPSGGTVTFATAALGAPAPGYRWQRLPAGTATWMDVVEGGAYTGAQTARLTVMGATLAMSGDRFRCVVSNGFPNDAVSAAVTLTVKAADGAPVFALQPVTQTALASGTATFTATAVGAAPLHYQWMRLAADATAWVNLTDTATYTGTGSSTLTVHDVAQAMTGDQFMCLVTNGVSPDAFSTSALLGVHVVPAWQTVAYDASFLTLPDAQGWRALGPPSLSEPLTFVDGALHQGPTSLSNYQYWQAVGIASEFTSFEGRVIELVLKVGSSTYVPGSPHTNWETGYWVSFIDPPGRTMVLGISDTGVRISNSGLDTIASSSAFVPFDTTTAFNTYQLGINNAGVILFINGKFVARLPLGPAGDSRPGGSVHFGDLSAQASSETYLRSIRWGVYGTPPAFSLQPVSQTAMAPKPATFTVAAEGAGTIIYQWQRRPAGAETWTDVSESSNYSGTKMATLSVRSTTVAMSGDEFRCLAGYGPGGELASQGAILTVLPASGAPEFVLEPMSPTVVAAQSATFHATATGSPAPGYRWQRRQAGSSLWTDLDDGAEFAGTTTSTLTVIAATKAMHGDQFHCIANNGVSPSAISRTASLAVAMSISDGIVWFDSYEPSLLTLPEAQGWTFGGSASPPPMIVDGTLYQARTSVPGYQFWERTNIVSDFSTPGGRVFEAVLKVVSSSPANASWHTGYDISIGDQARRAVGMGISEVGVSLNNEDTIVLANLDTTSAFKTYRIATNLAGTTLRVDGVTIATLPYTPVLAMGIPANYVWFADGTSGGASETYLRRLRWGQFGASPTFSLQPAGASVQPMASAAFAVKAEGFPTPAYQWQRQASGTTTWADLTESADYVGAKSAYLTLPVVTPSMAGDRFRCVAGNGLASDAISVAVTLSLASVPAAPVFTLSPTNQTANAGGTVTFTAGATGAPPPVYRWQRRPAGFASWTDLSDNENFAGATTATLTVSNLTAAMHGDQFRCTAENGTPPPAISGSAFLTVNVPPVIVSAARTKFFVGHAGSFMVAATGRPAPTFAATNLPAWATLNGVTGLLAGTPPDAAGTPFSFTITASNDVSATATLEFTLEVSLRHSADTSPVDGMLNLVELTRVIELYDTRRGSVRTGRYNVAADSVDGFTPAPTVENGAGVLPRYHSADANRDGRIDLRELTRVIALYATMNGAVRTGEYRTQSGTEDGFAPDP